MTYGGQCIPMEKLDTYLSDCIVIETYLGLEVASTAAIVIVLEDPVFPRMGLYK